MVRIISGKVIHGDALGRTLGFRTANISFEDTEFGSAVFKVNVLLNGMLFSGMGVNAVWKKNFEVHIFDFNEDIYGQEIEIYILKEIRRNQKFDSLEDLKLQLQKDKEEIQDLRLNILSFGSFDVVHKGHEHYLGQARRYGDYLITIIATDANIERIKERKPLHNQEERKKAVEELSLSDEVIIGSENSPLQWIEQYKPYAICLGYDQRGTFVDELPSKLRELGQESEIVRISDLEPEKYKSSLLKKEAL